MLERSVTVDEVIAILNSALESDREAIQTLVQSRVRCNKTLADHPEIQVGAMDCGHEVGILGILNGLFGVDENGWGFICAIYDAPDGKLTHFARTSESMIAKT